MVAFGQQWVMMDYRPGPESPAMQLEQMQTKTLKLLLKAILDALEFCDKQGHEGMAESRALYLLMDELEKRRVTVKKP